MMTVLTGVNSFLLHDKLQQLVTAFIAEHGDLALERIDGEQADFQQISGALTTMPFLASKKLVVLRSPSVIKVFAEKVDQLAQEIPDVIDVVIIEPKLDKRSSYYKFLKKATNFLEYNEQSPNDLAQWLVSRAKEQGGTLSASNARYLIERIGVNQQRLASEFEKLFIYDPIVTHQTIDLLTEATPQSTVFQLLEAAFAGNVREALELYAQQRALKVEVPQIIAMLAWQLHILAILKTAGDRSIDQIAHDTHLNPFVLRKSQAIVRRLSLVRLKALISDLVDLDVRSKRIAIDLDEALQHFLITLSA